MVNKSTIQSEIRLKDASLKYIAEIALEALYPDETSKTSLSIKDVSGNSGAKTFICHHGSTPKCTPSNKN